MVNDLIRPTTPALSANHDLGPAFGSDGIDRIAAINELPVGLVPLVLVVAQELGRTDGVEGDSLSLVTLATEMVMAASPPQGFGGWGVIPGWPGPEGATSASP